MPHLNSTKYLIMTKMALRQKLWVLLSATYIHFLTQIYYDSYD